MIVVFMNPFQSTLATENKRYLILILTKSLTNEKDFN